MKLELTDVTKKFQEQTAVAGVTLKLEPGLYGLLGANGAGKTSLMRLICGIQQPTTGTIYYNEQPIKELGSGYRNILGYLPQEFGYYPQFSGMDFLLYMATLKGLTKEQAQSRITELVPLVGLTEVIGRKIKKYSGGMKQRLGIAQALLNDPALLVLDEPTAGLDPKERIRFRNLLRELGKERIILLSTHIVADIESSADEILLMRQGKIFKRGTVPELLAPIQTDVWEVAVFPEEVDNYLQKFAVAQITPQGTTQRLRIIARTKPHEEAIPAVATLEDLYLFYFGDVSA